MAFKIDIFVFFSVGASKPEHILASWPNANYEWTRIWKLICLTGVTVCEEGADGEENFRNG